MGDLVLIPYLNNKGEWTLPGSVLQYAWDKMVRERLEKKVFYDGKVFNADSFIDACQSPHTHTHFMFGEDGDLAAIGFINHFESNHAHMHWVCYRNTWGEGAEQAARQSLKYWFHFQRGDKPLFDILLAIFPEDNPMIEAFARRIGITILGTVPGILFNKYKNKPVGAIISYIERGTVWDS